MKLRDKDTKKYLLTVFVATFVAYIIPAVVLYLGHFMGIMLTICISLFNLSMALLAWLWAKSVRKEFFPKTGGLTLHSRPIPELPLRPERK